MTRFEELLAARDVVQIKDVQGHGDASLTVATSLPGLVNKKHADLACVVPQGYIRYRFNSLTQHHGGGDNANVFWQSDNPLDGTVHLEVNCSGVNGMAHAEVNAVYAIRQAAAHKLDQEAAIMVGATAELPALPHE